MVSPQQLSVLTPLPSEVLIQSSPSPQRIFLLLHGFMESGQRIWRKCLSSLPEESIVLAPNAPFPLPEKQNDAFKIGYTWYFYDHIKMEYFIDMDVPIQFIQNLLLQLQLPSLPMTVIGFSQGGYLAPVLAQSLSQVDHVIGIGCKFRRDKVKGDISFRLDGIHGEEDSLVHYQHAKLAYQEFKNEGVKGEFYLLPHLSHGINQTVKDLLKSLVLQV